MDKVEFRKTKWIMGGFRALTKGGEGAIKVEAIARDIGVTKGGFYWDFKDLGDFKNAMLDFYQAAGTEIIIENAEKIKTPIEALIFIVNEAIKAPDDDFGGNKTELAIREWASRDANAKKRIQFIDNLRIETLKSIFITAGIETDLAASKAQILYSAYIGFTYLRLTNPDNDGAILRSFAISLLDTH
jgi:AcrR family transcriptional regulator